MNTAHHTLQKARSLASRRRANRHHGRGCDGAVDRDLVRETHEIYLLAQSTSPTMH